MMRTLLVICAALLALPCMSLAGILPDTGLTTCYDNEQEITCPSPGEPFYRQDANYVASTDFRNANHEVNVDQTSTCGNGSVEGGEECDDGNTLNGDCCSAECAFEPSGTPCGNQDNTDCTTPDNCTGDGYCSPRHYPGGTPCTSDGNVCTNDECSGGGVCLHINNTDPCDDDLYCNGAEACAGGVCQAGSAPCTPPEICDEVGNKCINCMVTIVPDSAEVSTWADFQFGTTTDGECAEPCYTWSISNQESTGSTIDQTGRYTAGRTAGTDIITVTDSCNGNITDEATVTVSIVPCDLHEDCDDGVFCNGSEICDPEEGCRPGSNPCPDDGLFCNGTEICSEQSDSCAHSGNPCDPGERCVETADRCSASTIVAEFNGLGGSRFYVLPGFVEIQGIGTDFGWPFRVEYEPGCPLLPVFPRECQIMPVPGMKMVNVRNQRITQLIIVMPSILPGAEPYPIDITVTVDEYSDVFEIPAFGK